MQSITLEALKEQFCVKDREEALVKIRECLDEELDIEWAADLIISIGAKMEEALKAEATDFTPFERMTWIVKEAFILGCLDMAAKMMAVNDMGYKALAEETEQRRTCGEV